MSKFLSIFLLVMIALPGCKKKENNIIQQAYGEPLRTYKRSKEKIKKIEEEHIKQLNAIEDSTK